ncbi:MAG: UDP-3-O-(3-hydroxymyristoyl)glucosamine N-acyltransferase [bacterium]|jgi:UDP-3-O-[3-hydroxymyristoyl] glucosamine N-acyltransferase|nr:UDP-3-O-(3-hydroxymyristoyl)glucosamine N-acyltransferase [candidate division KSB1 bacterium]MDH7559833.1 UDP-3-O-(3-hydroxymyristoyl)glucosamine N-acyltransferase [bacterium]
MTLADIAARVGGTVTGDGQVRITGLGKIQDARQGELTFLANPKYAKFVPSTRASAIILGQDFQGECPIPAIRVKDPYLAFLRAVLLFHPPEETLPAGVHPAAAVDPSAELGEGVAIGPLAVVGRNVRLGRNVKVYPCVVLYPNVTVGEDSVIHANVTVREGVQIGRRVIIHSGAVLGADGFGFVFQEDHYEKLPQTGTVIVEDDVEIGANTTIDRATLGATILRRGAKLDNLIQIAHNVEVGEHTVIAAQAGISGSTRVGKRVKIGGQAGFVGHLTIGDDATIGAQAGVAKDVPAGMFVIGYPAREMASYHRSLAALARLPELIKKVRQLEKELEELRATGKKQG